MSLPPQTKATTHPVIEETRHPPASSSRNEPAAFAPTMAPPRGVLKTIVPSEGKFSHLRLAPPGDLAPWVQHFWMVEWDLREASPIHQQTLPHPNVYLVFEQRLADPIAHNVPEISGVTTGTFSKTLEGWSRAFGVKFKPGGFRAFLGEAVSTLTDHVLPAQQVFGPSALELATRVYICSNAESMAACVAEYLAALHPVPDPSASLSAQLIDLIFDDPAILTVDQLAAKAGMGTRSLQRLFKEYVGVPPKWVIRRFRLHELVERLHSGQPFDGAELALDLGYADQAHLIRDFRNLVGYTPTGYRKSVVAKP